MTKLRSFNSSARTGVEKISLIQYQRNNTNLLKILEPLKSETTVVEQLAKIILGTIIMSQIESS